jgi:hypothetical protein
LEALAATAARGAAGCFLLDHDQCTDVQIKERSELPELGPVVIDSE